MSIIILLLKRYRVFLVFIFLELISLSLLITQNRYQNNRFLSSANYYIGSSLEMVNNIKDYFRLREINEDLATENRRLRELYTREKQKRFQTKVEEVQDPAIVGQYSYLLAKVVNNSVTHAKNYITINKGSKDGIIKNMAIISPFGIVGKVKSVNSNFSVVISLLSDLEISVKVKKNNAIGGIKWDGKSPKYVRLVELTDDTNIEVGDTIVTGHTSSFPPHMAIGKISKKMPSQGQTSLQFEVELFNDFSRLSYVYAIKNKLKIKQDTLEREVLEDIDE